MQRTFLLTALVATLGVTAAAAQAPTSHASPPVAQVTLEPHSHTRPDPSLRSG
jgi:hypothetical protein